MNWKLSDLLLASSATSLSGELCTVLGVIAGALGVLSFVPYIRDIFRGLTKPHAFSWLIWGLLTSIGFFGQFSGGAGPGSWVTGITGVITLYIFLLSLSHGEKDITRGDWICLLLCLAAIPLWIVTKTPLWSMILITVIDAVGYLPTLRKSYTKPFTETLSTYWMSALKAALGVAALTTFSVVTVLYPLSLVITNALVALIIHHRRWVLIEK